MMQDRVLYPAVVFAVVAAFCFGCSLGWHVGNSDARQAAFANGKAVMCIGRPGFFFTCEGEK